ncbi:hypothetical protein HNP48_004214 [Acidovorax soli]|uniref:Uncharacterized protein n=1 Tax=Acidovorax soli TaxID=592050 RepID=A0A7X0PGN1_9BURK|nr:hypothetical protein [Acidovorax soli]MBB6561521.1 hypothetical protein [Acidovorax soli]
MQSVVGKDQIKGLAAGKVAKFLQGIDLLEAAIELGTLQSEPGKNMVCQRILQVQKA